MPGYSYYEFLKPLIGLTFPGRTDSSSRCFIFATYYTRLHDRKNPDS